MNEKNALITGGAKRIGQAIALALAKEGWDIALHFHKSEKQAKETAARIEQLGRHCVLIQADLNKNEETATIIDKARQELGTLSLLVNNASTFYMDKIDNMNPTSWEEHIQSNLRAPLFLSQGFAAQAESDSNIINMLDQRVLKPTPYFFSYSIAKAGLWAATRMMALGLAPKIRVNAIGPGPTLPSPKQTEDQFLAHCQAMPLGRGSNPEEIARTVLFILQMPSMTGQIIALDGGEHLGWQIPGKGYQPKE